MKTHPQIAPFVFLSRIFIKKWPRGCYNEAHKKSWISWSYAAGWDCCLCKAQGQSKIPKRESAGALFEKQDWKLSF